MGRSQRLLNAGRSHCSEGGTLEDGLPLTGLWALPSAGPLPEGPLPGPRDPMDRGVAGRLGRGRQKLPETRLHVSPFSLCPESSKVMSLG